MKKYSGVALNVIVFVFLFIFLRIFSEYHFYCVEQNQLFQLTPIFIIDKLMQPGGLAMVLHSAYCGSYDNGGPADKRRGLVLGDLEADRSAKPWYFMGLASRPILVVCAMGF